MLTHPKILIWGAKHYEKLPKTGFRNVTVTYSKACKNKLMVQRPQIWLKMIASVSSKQFSRVTCKPISNFFLMVVFNVKW